jgi:F-type H+-transporting ATPase subunit b
VNLNITLILQSIAMMIFVWFCMKFLWPPLLRAMDERRARIAEGLAASDRAEKELEAAERKAGEQIREARDRAHEIVDQANQRRGQVLEQARDEALAEKDKQVAAAEAEISQAANQAREELRDVVARLAVLGAERIIEKEIDADRHRELLDRLISEI